MKISDDFKYAKKETKKKETKMSKRSNALLLRALFLKKPVRCTVERYTCIFCDTAIKPPALYRAAGKRAHEECYRMVVACRRMYRK